MLPNFRRAFTSSNFSTCGLPAALRRIASSAPRSLSQRGRNARRPASAQILDLDNRRLSAAVLLEPEPAGDYEADALSLGSHLGDAALHPQSDALALGERASGKKSRNAQERGEQLAHMGYPNAFARWMVDDRLSGYTWCWSGVLTGS
jgi:hypothetical protein